MSVRVGLIGYGLAGSAFHAPLVEATDRLDLAAIATTRREQVASDWPGVAVTTPEALLDDPAIELVVVASPNSSHASLARAALERDKHVVVDKPFVLDPDEGAALIALAAERQRMLTVYHNRRWDSDYRTVRQLLDSGRLGELLLFEAHWDRFRPEIKRGWREEAGEGAGLLTDFAPHLVDQVLQLFGPPEAIAADMAVQRAEAQVDDYFALTLHYGAMRVLLSAATVVASPRPRFALHGTRGSFLKFGLDPQEAALRAGHRPGEHGFGEELHEIWGTLTTPTSVEHVPSQRGEYVRFYEGVAAAVLDGAPVPVDPRDALAGLRLIELARQSAKEGRLLPLPAGRGQGRGARCPTFRTDPHPRRGFASSRPSPPEG